MSGTAPQRSDGAGLPLDAMRQIFIAAAVVAAFWGALEHAPRADQHMVLYQFQRYSGAAELFRETVSWPRSILKDDIHVFRPLGNLFMGLQWVLFGYLFPLYQAMGVALHAAVAVLLYRLSVQRLGVAPWLAVPGCLAFAFYPMSSEAVLWHTLNQMALWAILVLCGLSRYLAAPPVERAPLLAFALLVLAALVIDQGTVLIGVALHAGLTWSWRRWVAGSPPSARHAAAQNLLMASLALLLVIALNIADLYRTGWRLADLMRPAAAGSDPLLPMPFLVLRFWLAPFLLPSLYSFLAGGRMGIVWSLATKPLMLANLVEGLLFLAAAAGVVWGLFQRWRKDGRAALRGRPQPWMAPLIVALGFAALFVLGRGVSRGIEWALNNGLHASYPFMVMFIPAMLGLAGSLLAVLPVRAGRTAATLGGVALTILAGLQLNALLVTIDRFARFGAPDLAVYRAATAAYAQAGETEAARFTFRFRQPCDINYPLPWFRDGMTIAEAAFPRWYRGDSERVLDCPVGGPARPVAVRSSVAGTTPPRRLFDGVVEDDSFFRVVAWPVEVEATLVRPLRLTGYALVAGDHSWGMPTEWRLWGVGATGQAVLLDEQRDAAPWRPDESRRYALKGQPETAVIRFEFLQGPKDGMLLYEIELITE